MRLLVALLLAVPWSPPQSVGPPARVADQPALAFGANGSALLSWNTETDAGVGPKVPPPRGRLGSFAPATFRSTLRDQLAAPPVAYGRDRIVLLRQRTRYDKNFTPHARLGVSFGTTAGATGTVQHLASVIDAAPPALAANAAGTAAIAWVDYNPRSGLNRERWRLRLAVRRVGGGSFGRPRTVVDTGSVPAGANEIGDPVLAIGPGGEFLLAYARTRPGRGKRAVEALVGRTGGRLAHLTLGPERGLTDIAAAVGAKGRTVVAWGTQDAGEEAGEPWVVRAVTSARGRRFGRAQALDPGEGVDRPAGSVSAGVAADGGATVAWSAIRGAHFAFTHPVEVATAGPDGRFGAASQLAPDGAAGHLAVRADGRAIVPWVSLQGGNYQEGTQVFAALRDAGASAFGPAEAISEPEPALDPRTAFDPVGGAPVVVWAGRPGGQQPSQRADLDAVLRLATRTR